MSLSTLPVNIERSLMNGLVTHRDTDTYLLGIRAGLGLKSTQQVCACTAVLNDGVDIAVKKTPGCPMETCILFHAKQCHKNKSKRIVIRIAACTVPK